MKRVGFLTLGCKVNIYESNAIKNELIARGYEIKEPDCDCDVFIINTCSVTNMADAKSRKMIRKCVKMNPKAVVCVMGCYSQTNKEALELDGVDIIVGNGNKKEIINQIDLMVKNGVKEKYVNILDILEMHEYESLDVTTYDHTRAFVKIEDGCENFCTYCIIPYARGPIRCKPANLVIDELIRITEQGYLEIVLAGIHTGRYKDNDINLSTLIKMILNNVPKLKRLRLSSIEINEIDDDFIDLMKENDVLANHLHLPLQSGSDLVLSKMERKYDSAYFIEKVNKIKAVRPDISITTDIIVGFPYETEAEFDKTLELSKMVGFSKIHVFPYSMRKGTKACEMPQVMDSIKKDRANRLINLSKELENNYSNQFIGKELDLIVEQELSDNKMVGHTSNFLTVILEKDEKYITKLVKVRIDSVIDGKVYGEIIEK